MRLYSVILRLLSIVLIFIPKVRQRVVFERKNARDPHAKKFNTPADLAFEFSSEGELQQVLPLVNDALSAGKKIELIYFSPSVEKGVEELCSLHPDNLRALRFPFLTGGLLRWITSKKLFLVRYDLFPEFLDYRGELNMLWVSFKRERLTRKGISFWKKKFLQRSQNIVYASSADAEFGSKKGFLGYSFDFRIEQIRRRLLSRDEKFSRIFPEYQDLGHLNFPPEKRLIIGNAWPSDLKLFEKIPSDFFVLIVPHKLDPEIIREFKKFFGARGVVLNKKGVLCELYSDFPRAYVGGGFEASIHSVLEPLVSGSLKISCGTKNQRSTEFDVVESLGRMTVVENSQEFYDWLVLPLPERKSDDKIDSLVDAYPKYRKAIISC